MNDRHYFLNRAAQEEEAALAAASLTARWRHEELAGLYRLRAARLEPVEPTAETVPAFILLDPTTEKTAA